MLGILGTNNIHITSLLAPHALAPFTQFLDRAPDFHAASLAEAMLETQPIESRDQIANITVVAAAAAAGCGTGGACEKAWAQAIAAWGVHVHVLRAPGEERGAGRERAAEREGEGSGEHFGGGIERFERGGWVGGGSGGAAGREDRRVSRCWRRLRKKCAKALVGVMGGLRDGVIWMGVW